MPLKVLTCLAALTACLCWTMVPAYAQNINREQMRFDPANNYGLWSPKAVTLAYQQKYPAGAHAIVDQSFPNGGVNYGAHGQTAAMEQIGINPGVRWPELVPPFPIFGSEHMRARWKLMKQILGPEIEQLPGAMPLTTNYAASIAAASAMIEAEVEQSPEMAQARAQEEQNQANQVSADTNASMERSNAGSAIDYVASYLYNFTTNGDNEWNAVRNQLFLPMALLILLPGAILAQVKSIVAAGTPVVGANDVASPIEGILRSICAIFMIPATYLFLNYGIDLANSITYTIGSEYTQIFGTDMYQDALCAHVRAFPVKDFSENKGYIPNQMAQMGALGQPKGLSSGSSPTPFAQFEGQNLEVKLEDPCAGVNVDPADRANEMVPYLVNSQRNAYNTANAALAMSWNVMCAFQQAYLYYLWFAGPVVAALWVYPMYQLRQALPNWMQGVACVCFWSLFWNTVVLLMACLRGVDETGTMMMSALNFLATASVKTAFDFASLAKEAGQAVSQLAQQAASSSGGGGSSASGRSGAQGAAGRAGSGTPGAGGQAQSAAQPGGLSFMGATLPGASGAQVWPHFHGMGGTRGGEGGLPSGTTGGAFPGLGAFSPGLHSVSPSGVPEPPLLGSVATPAGLHGLIVPAAAMGIGSGVFGSGVGTGAGGAGSGAGSGAGDTATDGSDGTDGNLATFSIDPSTGDALDANGQMAAFAGITGFNNGQPLAPDHPNAVHLNAASLHSLLRNEAGAGILAASIAHAGGAYFTGGDINNQFISAQQLASNNLPENVSQQMSSLYSAGGDVNIDVDNITTGGASGIPGFGSGISGGGVYGGAVAGSAPSSFYAASPPLVPGATGASDLSGTGTGSGAAPAAATHYLQAAGTGGLAQGGAVDAAIAQQQQQLQQQLQQQAFAQQAAANGGNGGSIAYGAGGTGSELGAQFAKDMFGSGNFFGAGGSMAGGSVNIDQDNVTVLGGAGSTTTPDLNLSQSSALTLGGAAFTVTGAAGSASGGLADVGSFGAGGALQPENQFAKGMADQFGKLKEASEAGFVDQNRQAMQAQVHAAPENHNMLAKVSPEGGGASAAAVTGSGNLVVGSAMSLPPNFSAPSLPPVAADLRATAGSSGSPDGKANPETLRLAADTAQGIFGSGNFFRAGDDVDITATTAGGATGGQPAVAGFGQASLAGAAGHMAASGSSFFQEPGAAAGPPSASGYVSAPSGSGMESGLAKAAPAENQFAQNMMKTFDDLRAGAENKFANQGIGGAVEQAREGVHTGFAKSSPEASGTPGSGALIPGAAPFNTVALPASGGMPPATPVAIPGSNLVAPQTVPPSTPEYRTAQPGINGALPPASPGSGLQPPVNPQTYMLADETARDIFGQGNFFNVPGTTDATISSGDSEGQTVLSPIGWAQASAAAGAACENAFGQSPPAQPSQPPSAPVFAASQATPSQLSSQAPAITPAGDKPARFGDLMVGGMAKLASEHEQAFVNQRASSVAEAMIQGAVENPHALPGAPANAAAPGITQGATGGQSASAHAQPLSSDRALGGASGMQPVYPPADGQAPAMVPGRKDAAGGEAEALKPAAGDPLIKDLADDTAAFVMGNNPFREGRYDNFEQRAVDNSINVNHQLSQSFTSAHQTVHLNQPGATPPAPSLLSPLTQALGCAASNSPPALPIFAVARQTAPDAARLGTISDTRQQAMAAVNPDGKSAAQPDSKTGAKSKPISAASAQTSQLGSALGRALGNVAPAAKGKSLPAQSAEPANQAPPACAPRPALRDPMGSVASGTTLRRFRARQKMSAAERASMEKLGGDTDD